MYRLPLLSTKQRGVMMGVTRNEFVEVPAELQGYKGLCEQEDRIADFGYAIYCLDQLIGDEGPVDTLEQCLTNVMRVANVNNIVLKCHRTLRELREEMIIRRNAEANVLKLRIESLQASENDDTLLDTE